MGRRVARHLQSPHTIRAREYTASRTRLSPRMSLGLKLYGSGAVKTLKQAAEMVNCHPVSLRLAAQSPAGQEVMATAHSIIADKALSASELVKKLSRRMVELQATIAEDSPNEGLRLKAAQDLLDRNPETSKTQRIQAEVLSINGKDAQAIAAAMVEAAKVKAQFADATVGDYVKVDSQQDAHSQMEALTDASQRTIGGGDDLVGSDDKREPA